MSKIDERLRETSNRCIEAYEKWQDKQTDPASREELREAIHELRKVSSRLEIEMAVSEREEMAQKPIPIPPHRAARGKGGKPDHKGGDYKGGDNKGKGQGRSGPGNDGNPNGPSVDKIKSRKRKKGDDNSQSGGGKPQSGENKN